jgi:hypothetical protein
MLWPVLSLTVFEQYSTDLHREHCNILLLDTVSDLAQLLHWDLFVLSSATPCPVGVASVRFPTHIASPFYNTEQCGLIPHNAMPTLVSRFTTFTFPRRFCCARVLILIMQSHGVFSSHSAWQISQS